MQLVFLADRVRPAQLIPLAFLVRATQLVLWTWVRAAQLISLAFLVRATQLVLWTWVRAAHHTHLTSPEAVAGTYAALPSPGHRTRTGQLRRNGYPD